MKIRKIKIPKISKNRKWNILIWSLILTMVFDIVLIRISIQFTNKEAPSHPFYESTEPYYFTIKTYYTGPNYFFPYANVAFAFINQYNDEISGFHVYISFDNSSWVEIPLTKPSNIPPDPFGGGPNVILTDVGIIPLNGFSNILYAKCIFPPQGFDNATQTRIMNSFQGYMYFNSVWIPQSVATVILVSVALMSFIIQILDFWVEKQSPIRRARANAYLDRAQTHRLHQTKQEPHKPNHQVDDTYERAHKFSLPLDKSQPQSQRKPPSNKEAEATRKRQTTAKHDPHDSQ